MGGGKETPRQKMVGLMYLVLMALLALNVTKAVLDAFVAIEKNLQVGTLAQLDRGDSAIADLKEATQEKTNPEKVKKVEYYLSVTKKIDEASAKLIKEIDEIKISCLEKMGEVIAPADKNEEAIVWVPYSEKDPCRPALLHLMAVQAKDGYDVPMHEIIGEDLATITGSGKKLWDDYNKFRGEICELVGTYAPPGGKSYKFKTTPINKYKDNLELEKLVDKMIDANGEGYNKNDDREVLKEIYIKLSKNELEEHEEMEMHWIARTFDHSPIVAAIASLTALQQEILAARATALQHIKSRVSTGEYSFNKIMPLAFGPGLANSGDEVEINVMMAAFDSDNQPMVTGPGSITVADGKGVLKVKVSGGAEMVLNGTVAVKKKSGQIKKENWTHTIKIMKPQGVVSLPELNVLYRGYPNVIQGVASGYDQTILTGNGVTLTKTATGFIGTPGAGKSCSIAISGKNSVTNKTVPLGKFEFRIFPLPKAELFLGQFGSGQSVGVKPLRDSREIIAKYSDSPLKASFSVSSWEITMSGAPRPVSGKGPIVTEEAKKLLAQAKPGTTVAISATYSGMGKSGVRTSSVITVK